MSGVFVTFEGGEGSGKSTQVARLAARLRATGHDPLVTREPGGTPVGEGIRALLLDHERRPSAMTEALLMVASRAQLVGGVLRPALEAGRIVLCDRYGDSTLAYQGGGRGVEHALLVELNRAATGGLVPAVTLLFDVPVPVGLDRRHASAGATNRLDREPAEFHERVRARYLELAAAEPERWRVLDGTVGENELEARVWEAVGPRLALARS
ncbi:MAG: dTMP kinase [Candidatus Eisenbacteria bacterium]|nr:dTMP kinase [Candidatus Eisenbacteria bacterium]